MVVVLVLVVETTKLRPVQSVRKEMVLRGAMASVNGIPQHQPALNKVP